MMSVSFCVQDICAGSSTTIFRILVQPFWKSFWNYDPKVTRIYIPFDPVITVLGLYPKEIKEREKGII